jgi:hypothetical protein
LNLGRIRSFIAHPARVAQNGQYLQHGIREKTATCLTPPNMADNYGIFKWWVGGWS